MPTEMFPDGWQPLAKPAAPGPPPAWRAWLRGMTWSDRLFCGVLALFVVAAVAVIIIAAFGAGDASNDDDGQGDASAELACRHARNVARDYTDGVLTLFELRGKLVEVEDDAQFSAEPGVASGARAMLSAITQGDAFGFDAAVESFDASCTRAGF